MPFEPSNPLVTPVTLSFTLRTSTHHPSNKMAAVQAEINVDLDAIDFLVYLMTKSKVPKAFQDLIMDENAGWATANEMHFSCGSDKAGWEEVVKKVMLSESNGIGLKDEHWTHHRVTGSVRRLFKEVEAAVGR